MKLPADCPHRLAPPDARPSADLSGCCRGQGGDWLLGNEEPLCRTMGYEDEAYRFVWRSSFHGNAIVRIGCRDRATTLRWRYDWFRTAAPDDAPDETALSPNDWARFLDALIGTNFWALDPTERALGLDGAEWLIEGRRGNLHRRVSRWSPRGELFELGRMFFDLAGLPLSRVKLY
jgi:hypothetical protein